MTARTVSELANWDGRRDQQRQNSKRPTRTLSSPSLARDPYHTSLRNQPLENARSPGRVFDQKRAERSSFHSTLELDPFTNAPTNKRLSSLVDTTSMSSHDTHNLCRLSISSNVSSSRLLSSSFTGFSKSSNTTPNTSVHVSSVHKPPPLSSSPHIPLSLTSENNPQVIDLTLEDTEDELSVDDELVADNARFRTRNQRADPSPSRRGSASESSSPMPPEQSLFTPPPPARLIMSYLVVPPFPKGLTKVDYRPMSEYLGITLSPSTVPEHTPSPESPAIERQVHSPKGKEREHIVSSPPTPDKSLTPPDDVDLCVSLDTFDEPTIIPLQDDGTYPPLTPWSLRINTRFYFVHAWRANASRLQESESEWTLKILGKPFVWNQSVSLSSPCLPGTAGYTSSEQLRPWELVPPESSLPGNETKDALEERIKVETHTVDVDHLPLPHDAPHIPNVVDPSPSDSTVSQGLLPTAVDMDHDMNRYFDGLGDSPHKQHPLRQPLGPTHTFRPHLLQSARRAQMNAFGLDFAPLEFDPRLTDAGGNECFLGIPPSPPAEDIDPSVATQPTGSSFEPASYFPAEPSSTLPGNAPLVDGWVFEQGDGPLPDNDPPPRDQVSPIVSGTIDPSLLGLEQPQTLSVVRKDATPKKRSKLPEPVIYVRRPMDPSSLPLLSRKRPVQIKYRDAEGSFASPSARTGSEKVPSSAVDSPAEASTNDGDGAPRVRSVPTRKRVEAQVVLESDSDHVPEAFASQSNQSKLKRQSHKSKGSVSGTEEPQSATAPAMSYCHQCRNKTSRPKMKCSNVTRGHVCGKRFCNRCILYRYPDITFDEHSAGFLCPVCTNTCNCSHCSRNRGEEFVSMRLGGFATSLFTAKVTLVRGDKPSHRTRSPSSKDLEAQPSSSPNPTTPTPEPGAAQSQFWAHVYGMEGEHMGSAFLTREHMARLRAGVSPSAEMRSASKSMTTGKKAKTRTKKRTRTGPRVFIGEPLTSWRVRAVRDLEPSVDVDVKGKGKATCARRRYYVGNPAALHEPYGRMPSASATTPRTISKSLTMTLPASPMMCSDRSMTPMCASGGEDEGDGEYWPQPAVGEFCSWAPGMMVTESVPGGTDVDGLGASGLGLDAGVGASSGSSTAGMDVDGVTNGDEREPVTRALPEEDMARAISAALAALSVDPLP